MSDVLVLNPDGMALSVVPISTLGWQDAIKASYVGHVEVLHTYEDWFVHSPSTTIAVPSVVMTREFVNVGRNPKFSKPNVYLRDRYTCQYCGERFPAYRLTWDHVVPRFRGGKTRWDNVVAACEDCNTKKAHHEEMKPRQKPVKPTYFQLVAIKQEEVLEVPHPVWNFYLGWPEERVRVVSRRPKAA